MNSQVSIPRFFYGTAWKETQTTSLTTQALEAGFKAVDTANQRVHYYEEGVGVGVQKFLNKTKTSRENLFLQTKFTYARGQDHRKPYNENDPFTKQVADSFESSLKHLNTNYIDSYILHGPHDYESIIQEDLETWAAMEKLFNTKKVRYLGVSNISSEQLIELLNQVRVKPKFVQNRCFARFGWDREMREICESNNILYQGFSLLTANVNELSAPIVSQIARKYRKTIPQIIFRFCQQLHMICLTGTTNLNHMKQDLEIEDFELSLNEISQIENIATLAGQKSPFF